MTAMEIWLVRHGKTRGNLERRYIGSTDEPLAPEGREELSSLWKERNEEKAPQLVFTSALRRTGETASLLFPGAPQRALSGFNETNFGNFENKTYEELCREPAYKAWLDSGGMDAPPGGEGKEAFLERVEEAFEAALSEAFSRKLSRAVFVLHGGCIMALMERFGPAGKGFYHWQVKNGRGFALSVDEGEWKRGRKNFTKIRSIPS